MGACFWSLFLRSVALILFTFISRFAINQSDCRHAMILSELGQRNLTSKENGECCDNCQATEIHDVQHSCKTLLTALCHHPGVGRTTLIDTIAGLKTTASIKESSVFGTGSSITQAVCGQFLDEFMAHSLVTFELTLTRQESRAFVKLNVGGKGHAFLQTPSPGLVKQSAHK